MREIIHLSERHCWGDGTARQGQDACLQLYLGDNKE